MRKPVSPGVYLSGLPCPRTPRYGPDLLIQDQRGGVRLCFDQGQGYRAVRSGGKGA